MPEETAGEGASEDRAASRARPYDVVVIGAGFGGICMGIKALQAGLGLLVLERADDLGGVWRDNVYPGCACDTQSHHYSFSFARNPDWSRRFASQAEIHAYLRRTADDFGLRAHIRFGQEVAGLEFDAAAAFWCVRTAAGGHFRTRFVVSAVGQLNQAARPDIPGLEDFAGRQMHSAAWDSSYDVRGKSLAVIGSGASAIQMIPPLAKVVRRLVVFQRSPNWVVAKEDRPFSQLEKALFRYLPLWARLYRASIYWNWERSWPEFLEGSRRALKRTREIEDDIRGKLGDSSLVERVTPSYPLGCKRILLSDDLYPALQRENVAVVTSRLMRIEGRDAITEDGRRYALDCIALATGFTSHDFLPGVTVRGRDGADLKARWAARGGPEAYLGIAEPGFPNLFFLYGPNTNLGHNSIVFMLECQVHFVMKAVAALAARGGRCLEVTEAAKTAFQRSLEADLAGTAWAGACNSWYKTPKGKIVNNWSGDTVTYWRRTRRPDLSDFKIT